MRDQPTAIKVTRSHIFPGNISTKWISRISCVYWSLWRPVYGDTKPGISV